MRVQERARKLVDACRRLGKYQPPELLRWLVNDVLADLGVRQIEPPSVILQNVALESRRLSFEPRWRRQLGVRGTHCQRIETRGIGHSP